MDKPIPDAHRISASGDVTHEVSLNTVLEQELAIEREHLTRFQQRLDLLRQKAEKRVYIPLRNMLQRNHEESIPDSYLEVIGGWQSGERFTIEVGRTAVVGRDKGADLVLRDNGISRAHCKIKNKDAWAFQVKDLGSHNGTRLNGKRIDEATLEHGDLLWVGLTFIYFSSSLTGLAMRVREHSFLRSEELQNVLRYEDTIHHIQVGVARISYELWRLDHADRKKIKPSELAMKVHRFKENAEGILRDLEEERVKADGLLMRVVQVPSTVRVERDDSGVPSVDPQERMDTILKALLKLRSDLSTLQRFQKKATGLIKKQIIFLREIGREREAEALAKESAELITQRFRLAPL